jgi:hypothetical protein
MIISIGIEPGSGSKSLATSGNSAPARLTQVDTPEPAAHDLRCKAAESNLPESESARGSRGRVRLHTLDTALIMAADTISGYIQGLLDGIEFKQAAYALDRDSRKAALARFLKRASGSDQDGDEEERRLAA